MLNFTPACSLVKNLENYSKLSVSDRERPY
jgi:hypothetical protein